MTNKELVKKLIDIANNYKTLYVMGCFGAPMTESNKQRYINHHEYNRRANPKKCIMEASSDTFGFDCVNLIKSILWGWKLQPVGALCPASRILSITSFPRDESENLRTEYLSYARFKKFIVTP